MAKTIRPMVRVHDLATDEVIDSEMDDAEYANWEQLQVDNAEQAVQQAAKEAARAAAIAKLEALGLTPEDLAAL